jgi:hypothetical protein
VKPRSLRLGEILEQRGRVAHEQTLRALRNQKVLGGRLGTCLLEIDALSEEELLSALSEIHGVPAVGAEDLRGIPSEVIALIPQKVAIRCLAIPFYASGSNVKVAVANARDLAIQDEINFVVGRRVRWHVASDLRIHEALEKYYGSEAPARFTKLLDRLNRSRFMWSREEGTAPAAEETHELPELMPPQQPVPEVVAAPAPAASTPAAPAPVPAAEEKPAKTVLDDTQDIAETGRQHGALDLPDAEQLLLDPKDRDDVARTVLDFAATRVRRAVALVVRKQEITAWVWVGEGLHGPRLAAWRVGLEEPSILVALQKGSDMFRGALPPVPAHRELLAAFDPPPVTDDLVALPLRVRGRLVAVLLVEPLGERLDDATLSELQRITAKAAIAFELCIMRAKLRKA